MLTRKSLTLVFLMTVLFIFTAAPGLAQDPPPPPEDPPGMATGVALQFVVTSGDSIQFTITATDSIDAVIQVFTPLSLQIGLEGVTGVDSTQITIVGFPPDTVLYKFVDDLRNIELFTTDATGAYSFMQDLSTPHLVMIKQHPSTWYLDDNGWTPRIQVPLLLKWGSYGSGDGQFNYPAGVKVSASGNVHIVDRGNHRVQVFDATGSFLASWGSFGTGDGQFNGPTNVAIDGSGNVYVTDYNNHRVQKFDAAGGFLAKWGSFGTGDGQFNHPIGVEVDASNNVYVVDRDNHRVQKFDATGGFLTKWGSFGTGEGQFKRPWGVATDASGNLYVVDGDNHRLQKFDAAGTFLAKWGSYGTGDGQFVFPANVCVDASGNVYVAGRWIDRIQKFDAAGSFLAKWGSSGTGDGQFDYPEGVAGDGAGNLYVTDCHNHRVKKFDASNISEFTPGTWDSGTKTAVLTQDVYETIQITGTGITLNGAKEHYQVTSTTGDGVYIYGGSGNVVENLRAQGAHFAIRVNYGSLATVRNCEMQGREGVSFYRTSFAVANDNIATVSDYPLRLDYSSNAMVSNNQFSNNYRPLYCYRSNGCLLFHNNWNHSLSPWISRSSSDFSLPLPFGGNHWSVWTTPDADNNDIVDNAYYYDYLPYKAANGWVGAPVLDFNNWSVENYIPAVDPPSHWVIGPDGMTATQAVNSSPGLLMSDVSALNTRISATVAIAARASDDDLFGFVIGYQPGDWDNPDAEYLLLDWKKGTQTYDQGSPSDTPGSTSYRGLALSRVLGVPTWDEFWGHVNFDHPSSDANNGVEEIARATNIGDLAWTHGQVYEFTIEYTATSIKVFVNGQVEIDVSGTCADGRWGLYTLSQQHVAYQIDEYTLLSVSVDGTVTADCGGALAGVTLNLTDSEGAVHSTVTDIDGNYVFTDLPRGGTGAISVVLPPNTVALSPEGGTQTLEFTADQTVDFSLGCLFSISGTVTSDCQGALAGITVDLTDADGYRTLLTEADGTYQFDDIRYQTEIEIATVMPLGFRAVSPMDGHAGWIVDADITLVFDLECLQPTGTARSMGYWKHQARVYNHNKGNAQESEADMDSVYAHAIFNHFYENDLNAIEVPGVTYMMPDTTAVPLTLVDIENTLTVNRGRNMEDRAKQHYLACLLNMASGRIMTFTEVSEDGKTASQALQYVATLIMGDPSGHELAKDIAETMNDAQLVAAGVIPEEYNYIPYSRPVVTVVAPFLRVSPNPGYGAQSFQFYLAEPGMVRLDVFDVSGRLVRVVQDGVMDAGLHTLPWDGSSRVSGIYFTRFRGPGLSKVVKFIHLSR